MLDSVLNGHLFHINRVIFLSSRILTGETVWHEARGGLEGVILFLVSLGNIWTLQRTRSHCKRGERLFISVTLKAVRSSSGERKEVKETWEEHMAEARQHEVKMIFLNLNRTLPYKPPRGILFFVISHRCFILSLQFFHIIIMTSYHSFLF